jgi:hypothetical protein
LQSSSLFLLVAVATSAVIAEEWTQEASYSNEIAHHPVAEGEYAEPLQQQQQQQYFYPPSGAPLRRQSSSMFQGRRRNLIKMFKFVLKTDRL